MKKFILMGILFPFFSYASDLNLSITKDTNTISTSVNIITVNDTIFDQNGASQTLVLFTDNGKVYYSLQAGRSCNYKSGKTEVKSYQEDVIITPNSSCNTTNQIVETW